MENKKRVDRVDIGVMDRGKVIDVYSKEFTCSSAGKVQGDLDSGTADVRGACKVGGDARVSILKVGGSMKVMGSVKAELIRVKGALKVEGSVNSDHFRIAGATKVLGKIESAEEILVQGVLKCSSDMNANRFKLLGSVSVDGRLKASVFDAELGGRSSIRHLESEIIKVKVGTGTGRAELIVKSIIGGDIYLENTVAESVEGRKVVIGPGCSIAQVKAAELDVHKGSNVGKRL